MNSLRWLEAIRQDARFGVRMPVKYRGMMMVGACAMAVAIAVGALMAFTVAPARRALRIQALGALKADA